MKTTVKELDYEKVMALPQYPHLHPIRPGIFWRTLVRGLSILGLAGTHFHYTSEGMEKVGKNEPCLILMNHSCFLDLQIASTILYPRPYNIICTSDGFVGMGGLMAWAMRTIGCVPTRKFVTDLTLVQDMVYCLKDLKSSVLMYPEASYSFDGTCTALPRKMGVLLKKLDVPVVMIETFGAFSRNPLYNELQVRKSVPVSAKVRLLYSREDLKEKSVKELSDGLDKAFSFDQFRWQRENGIQITDGFRADGLERILYKCPHCGTEGELTGKGTGLTCRHCGKHWELTPIGDLAASEGETEFSHVPDWYRWEREQVRRELEDGTYKLDIDVDIAMMVHGSAAGPEEAYYWYEGSSAWNALPADERSHDLAQHIPTYETVLQLRQSAIVTADYRQLEGLSCIYVEVRLDDPQRTERYWIGLDSGLLVQAETEEEGTLTYRLSALSPITTAYNAAAAFSLPDGTSLHNVT